MKLGITTNLELINYATKLNLHIIVCSKDEINNYDVNNFNYIINLSDAIKIGTHWVAYTVD